MSEIIETMARGTHGYAFRLLERKPNAYMDERKMRERAAEICEQARLNAELAIAALNAAGYAIVKREPDEAMIDAAIAAAPVNNCEITRIVMIRAYRAMISAQEGK